MAEYVHFFMELRDQLKLYHWHTKKYARHAATDKVIHEVDELIDSFIEVYIGIYGRQKLLKENAVITLQNLTDAGAKNFLQNSIRTMKRIFRTVAEHRDLVNILDEILKQLDHLLYLFTLQ